MFNRCLLFICSVLLTSTLGFAAVNRVELSVWANEAIVAVYTFDSNNYLQQQKNIAKYFTANGWIAYSKAFNESKLAESIEKNVYEVSAVATKPPVIIFLPDNKHWKAVMNLLVLYQNPQYEQRQHLKVTLGFEKTPGKGVRGLSINSLQTEAIDPPCECKTGKI